MDSRSSVEAAPVGAFVSWLLSAAASAQFALFLESVLGKVVWPAWGVALLAFGWGARLASNPGRDRNLISSQAALMIAPLIGLVIGVGMGSSPLASFSGAFLGIFAVGWGLAVPVAQWISGTAPRRADGRPPALPLPGASFAIALFFALPASRLASGIAGMIAVVALVLAASLGSISGRSSEGGAVTSAPQMWTRWAGAALLVAAVAGLIGFVLTNAIRPASLLGTPMGGPPLPKNGQPTVSVESSGSANPTPPPEATGNPNPSPQSPPGVGQNPSDSGQGSRPDTPKAEDRPERDWREYLRLAAIALLALAALALAKRYGDRIQAFLNRLLSRLATPFAQMLQRWRESRETAQLWGRASALPDPFALPDSIAARGARLEATLAALGTARRPEEPPALHLKRASLSLGGDAELWNAATRAVNRARFGGYLEEGSDAQALAALDEEMMERLSKLPDAEDRRREVRMAYARELTISPPEQAPV